jgi:hypothetical protein
MTAAPHLAATVQRNVAIFAAASDLPLGKGSDTNVNLNMASKVSGGTTGLVKAKPLSSKNPDHAGLKNHEKCAESHISDASMKILEKNAASAVFSNPSNLKLDSSKKQKSKSKSAPVRPPGASSSTGAPISSCKTLKAPPSSEINTTLSKKLVRSATHVYIANYIKEMKKAQEALKKIEEKQQNLLLRQQQEQRMQHKFQQQQQIQHQIHHQQQMMHYLQSQRSQQAQPLQSRDTFMSKAMTQPFTAVQPPTASTKTSSQVFVLHNLHVLLPLYSNFFAFCSVLKAHPSQRCP